MWEDAKQFWSEFDMSTIVRPQGVDGFMFSLVALLIVGAVVFVAAKLIFGLIR